MTQRLTRSRGWLRAAIRAERGAAAVEMALIAAPFLMLLFGIVELGMIFLVSSTLENSMDLAARTIRTGQLQGGGGATAATFKSTICTNFGWMQTDCANNLSVDVRTYATFADTATPPQPVSNGVFNAGALTFVPGGPNDIVVVRAYYKWPLIAPMFDQALQQLNGGVGLLTSTAAFRNEPYGG